MAIFLKVEDIWFNFTQPPPCFFVVSLLKTICYVLIYVLAVQRGGLNQVLMEFECRGLIGGGIQKNCLWLPGDITENDWIGIAKGCGRSIINEGAANLLAVVANLLDPVILRYQGNANTTLHTLHGQGSTVWQEG